MKVLIVGAAGMIGRKLTARLVADGKLAGKAITHAHLVDIVAPEKPASAPFTAAVDAFDIAAPYVAPKLIAPRPDVIFLLASVVSGEAEADFDKGYAINVGGTQFLFEAIRREQALSQGAYKPRLIFTSSIAVFGAPFPEKIGDEFVSAPLTSYGTQKAICELLLNDYSRRGFFDGIGIDCRPSASGPACRTRRRPASSPASSASRSTARRRSCRWTIRSATGTLRPARRSNSCCAQPSLISRELGARRSLSMPGVSVTVGEQIEALRAVAGDKTVALIRRQPDETIGRIVSGWARDFDPARAKSLGFRADANFSAIINAYIEDELKS